MARTSREIQTRCLVNSGCSLGEGPTWDRDSQRLYWVDILENRIYRHDPADGSTHSWTTPEHVGFVVVRPDGELVAGFKSGLHHVVLNDDATVTSSRIDRVDGNRDDVRFNDATSDAGGRIWACTLGGTPGEPLGTYYCYDTDLNRRTVDDGYLVANGPALSPDRSLLYTIETSGHPGRQKGVSPGTRTTPPPTASSPIATETSGSASSAATSSAVSAPRVCTSPRCRCRPGTSPKPLSAAGSWIVSTSRAHGSRRTTRRLPAIRTRAA